VDQERWKTAAVLVYAVTLHYQVAQHNKQPIVAHRFPGLFADTSELIRFYFFHFSVVGSVQWIKLTCQLLSTH